MVHLYGVDHPLATERDRRAAIRVGGFNEAEKLMGRKAVELVRTVELIKEEGGGRLPSIQSATRLQTVRLALMEGDVAAAATLGRVFELTAMSAWCAPSR